MNLIQQHCRRVLDQPLDRRQQGCADGAVDDAVIDRILFLDGVPNMQRYFPVVVGEDAVEQHKNANIPVLARYAKDGYAIVSAVPSCTLMFKQEIPLMYPGDADVALVRDAMWDPFEYLMARKRDGLLKTEFTVPLGKISYQIPCHGRVQNIGKKTEEMLKMVPGTSVHTHERCSGHAGTFGVKKATHQQAMKIGKPLFKKMAEHPQGGLPDYISSDCPLGGHHIAQGFEASGQAVPELQHPLSLVAKAYGLK